MVTEILFSYFSEKLHFPQGVIINDNSELEKTDNEDIISSLGD